MRLNGCSVNGAALNGAVAVADVPLQIQTIFLPEKQPVITARGVFKRGCRVAGRARVTPLQWLGAGVLRREDGSTFGVGRLRKLVGAPKIVVVRPERHRLGSGAQVGLGRSVTGRGQWDLIRVEGFGSAQRPSTGSGSVELGVVLQVSSAGWRVIMGSAEVQVAPKVESVKRKDLTMVAVALALAEATID